MVRKRSNSRSMAQAITTSNFPAAGVLEHGVETRPLAPALGTADTGIPVDLDHLPAAPLGHLPELEDLVLDGLCVRRHPHIKGGALLLGHDLMSPGPGARYSTSF